MEAKESAKDYLRYTIGEKQLELLTTAEKIGKTTEESKDLVHKVLELTHARMALNRGGLEKMENTYQTLVNNYEGGIK